MAHIIAFKPDLNRSAKRSGKKSATAFSLLFFTGVQYERDLAKQPIFPAAERPVKIKLKKA